jgi:primosomal protein N' (replication factor Y)
VVDVFMRSKLARGIVVRLKDKTEFDKVKPVSTVLPHSLPLYQLDFLLWFSEQYFYSPASTATLFLPEIPKRKQVMAPRTPVIPAPQKQNDSISKLAEDLVTGQAQNFLLFGNNINTKYALFAKISELVGARGGQTAVIFPQRFKIDEFLPFIPQTASETVGLFTNEEKLSMNRAFTLWNRINSAELLTIVGTRSTIFAPFSKLKFIIIDDADSDDLKQWDQNPRYHVIESARKLCELTGAKLILSSNAPRIEDAWLAKENRYKIITLGNFNPEKLKIVNLKEERKKVFTYLSEDLVDELKTINAAHKKALLFVNKKGLYSNFCCDDCNYVENCPDCGLPLTVSNTDELICFRCNNRKPLYLACPKCNGTNLRKSGIGIEQVQQTLWKVHGIRAQIATDETAQLGSNIILSTNPTIKREFYDSAALVAVVYADSLVHLPDFNSNFKLYSFLKEIILRATSFGDSAKIMIQTAFPDNPAFKHLTADYKTFYEEEIANRKMFGYPPFATLFKLFFDHHDLEVAQREARMEYGDLKDMVESSGGKLSTPFLHYRQKVRNRYRYQIAVFIPPQNDELEKKMTAATPPFWNIDRNPVSML